MSNNGGILGDVNATMPQNTTSNSGLRGNDQWGFGNDWVVNVPVSSGSGLTLQGGASGTSSLMWIVGGLAALFFFTRKGK